MSTVNPAGQKPQSAPDQSEPLPSNKSRMSKITSAYLKVIPKSGVRVTESIEEEYRRHCTNQCRYRNFSAAEKNCISECMIENALQTLLIIGTSF